MLTNLMTIAPETPAGKTTGPNRYPPQPEGTATDRFAALLQQRRQSSPESSPESSQKAPPQSQPPVKASQPQPEPKQAPKTAAPRDAEGNTGTDGTKADAAGNAPETDAAPQASTGCETAHPKGLLGRPPLPPDISVEQPIVDAPPLPPQAADEVLAASTNTTGKPDASDDAAGAGDAATATPEMPVAAVPFWPGMPHAAGLAPAANATDPLASAGGTDARAGSATGLAGSTIGRGAAGESGAGSQGGRDAGGSADDNARDTQAAGLLAAAAHGDADKAAKATDGRFALPPRAPTPIEASPGFIGHAGGIAARGAEAAATASVALPTPLHAPDFAKALGAQVSLFARNGLAQAELQLNPADMGPIRVQIAIEGAHARVDFAADAAVTRQVIERGLPELASALREQGLTLSGGGVFQRAPDQRGDADTPAARATRGASRRVGEAVPADTVAPAAHARASAALRGGVDLYA
ncbi:MAG: flagellar hook-length control protein FliK [Rhizobacter sp.]|nr:flagellar hook-length control protein FliK [Rhizobacter sp.]